MCAHLERGTEASQVQRAGWDAPSTLAGTPKPFSAASWPDVGAEPPGALGHAMRHGERGSVQSGSSQHRGALAWRDADR